MLVAGWFSFEEVIATVGDELGAAEVCRWLAALGVEYDVAWAPFMQPAHGGVDWREVDPAGYSTLVFVSGPLSDQHLLRALTRRFQAARRVAVNVSVVDPAGCGLFDAVVPRDGRVDPALAAAVDRRPVVAVAFAPFQEEYGERSRASEVRAAIEAWLADRALPWFEVDMDLYDMNHVRRPAQPVSLISRADVVVSMRLHALVLGLAGGTPVIACDAIVGGAKVTAQAEALGWPLVLTADQVSADRLDDMLAKALADESAQAVSRCVDAGLRSLDGVRVDTLAALELG